MGMDLDVLALSKRYTYETVMGGGAVKGKNCTIEKKEAIEGGTRMTFLWTLDDGTEKRTTLDVKDGNDGLGISDVKINAENHLIITFDDGTTDDAGEVASEATKYVCYTDFQLAKVINGGTNIDVTHIYPEGTVSALTIDDIQVGKTLVYDINGTLGVAHTISGSVIKFTTIVVAGSGGGGGSAELEESLTTSVTVGGISSGKTYAEGTSLENIFRDMLNPVAYPTLTNPSATLTATGAKLLEVGATLNTVMTITFNRGSINPAYGTSGYRSGPATAYSLPDGTPKTDNTFDVTVTQSKLSYQGSVSYSAGEQPKDSTGANYSTPLSAGSVNTNAITYEFVEALWANTANITSIAKLALVSKSAKLKEFSFPSATVANPEVFDVPASWTVTAVEVLNTLSNQWENCASEFSLTDVTHNDAGGNAVAYKRYTNNLGYAMGARKVRIKWS